MCIFYRQTVYNTSTALNHYNLSNSTADLQYLDLSNNSLTQLNENVFHGIEKAKMITLKNNQITHINLHIFQGGNVAVISTDNFKICCVTDSKCEARPTWPYSCGRMLLTSITLTVFMWLAAIVGSFLNSVAAIFNFRDVKHAKSGVSYNYSITVMGIVFTYVILSISLLVICIANTIYGENYFTYEYSWRSGGICYTNSFFSLIIYIMSCTSISFMALSRYYLVKKPFDTLFLSSTFVISCIVCMVVLNVSIREITLNSKIFFSRLFHCLPRGYFKSKCLFCSL